MQLRDVPFETGEYYHIFNKTIDRRLVFTTPFYIGHFYQLIEYYRSENSIKRFSHYVKLCRSAHSTMALTISEESSWRVHIISYCLMPNHFHFLLKQTCENGISKMFSQVLNAFTRTHNLLHKRHGQIFLSRFQSRHIKSERQLLHVSRYINLNPYTSYVLTDPLALIHNPICSLGEFNLKYKSGIKLCDKSLILNHFKTNENYIRYVLKNAKHQRKLHLATQKNVTPTRCSKVSYEII